MIEIRYKMISMRNQKMIDNFDAVLKLYDDYADWEAICDAEEPKSENMNDHSIGWEKIHLHYRNIIKKQFICSVEIEFQQTSERDLEIDKDKWGVFINDPYQKIKLWFRSQSKAEEVFLKIKQWWLS